MKTSSALVNASQALAITSQLLAIGIELGLIAGGIYIYKKFIAEKEPEKEQQIMVPEGTQIIQIPYPNKPTFKEKFAKAKKIFMAVVS